MAEGGGKAAVIGAAVAALAVGMGVGWIAGRATLPPPPPAPAYVNPLADAGKDEVLLLAAPDGATQGYRVRESLPDSVRLTVEDTAPDGRTAAREFRVARSFVATLYILDGDILPEGAEAAVRDFIIDRAEFEDLRVENLDRTFHCLKVTGRYRTMETRTYWITDELPVHGIARIDGPHGKRFEVRSFSFGKGK